MSHQTENRMGGEHAHEGAPHHAINYYGIFALLVVLTIVTVGVAFWPAIAHGPEWLKVLVALAIASVKAAFVGIFFMHLKFEGKLIYALIIIPLILTVIIICALIPDVVMPALNNWMLGRPY